MSFSVKLRELRGAHVGVELRRGHAGVAEQLLDRPKVGTTLEQVGGKRMTERMWANPKPGARLRNVTADQPVHAARG